MFTPAVSFPESLVRDFTVMPKRYFVLGSYAMMSIPVWSTTEASNPERESQLQTTCSPKMPTILVWRLLFSTMRLMVASSYRDSSRLTRGFRTFGVSTERQRVLDVV